MNLKEYLDYGLKNLSRAEERELADIKNKYCEKRKELMVAYQEAVEEELRNAQEAKFHELLTTPCWRYK